jgi:predicted Zn finger-like uncharacterized protein
MFTRCPECQKTHTLTLEQLRVSRGMMRCSQCSALFDALAFISETADREKPTARHLPWEKVSLPDGSHWGAALLLGVLLLAAQIVYFEGPAISQHATFRPWLESLCSKLSCQLPAYKNLDEFTVMHGSFAMLPDHSYAFKAVISNQAVFRQPYPNIRLTLFDFNGSAFAHRLFQPHDYLPAYSAASAIDADASTEINLNIAAPDTPVGGYTFELVY